MTPTQGKARNAMAMTILLSLFQTSLRLLTRLLVFVITLRPFVILHPGTTMSLSSCIMHYVIVLHRARDPLLSPGSPQAPLILWRLESHFITKSNMPSKHMPLHTLFSFLQASSSMLLLRPNAPCAMTVGCTSHQSELRHNRLVMMQIGENSLR